MVDVNMDGTMDDIAKHLAMVNFKQHRLSKKNNKSINQSINRSIDRSIDRWINQSIHQSINQSNESNQSHPSNPSNPTHQLPSFLTKASLPSRKLSCWNLDFKRKQGKPPFFPLFSSSQPLTKNSVVFAQKHDFRPKRSRCRWDHQVPETNSWRVDQSFWRINGVSEGSLLFGGICDIITKSFRYLKQRYWILLHLYILYIYKAILGGRFPKVPLQYPPGN